MKYNTKALTLIELVIATTIMSFLILGFYSIESFSRNHLLSSERRLKTQNELSYALEHMTKYVQQGVGNFSNPALRNYPPSGSPRGFSVRVDLNSTQTPDNFSDDSLLSYYLNNNTLYASCSGAGCPFGTETLSNRVCSNFVSGTMPSSPAAGFYVSITEQGSVADIGLVGRYDPTAAVSLDNPQIALKTKLYCGNSPSN